MNIFHLKRRALSLEMPTQVATAAAFGRATTTTPPSYHLPPKPEPVGLGPVRQDIDLYIDGGASVASLPASVASLSKRETNQNNPAPSG